MPCQHLLYHVDMLKQSPFLLHAARNTHCSSATTQLVCDCTHDTPGTTAGSLGC